ncbi:hypothetical protein A5810_001534, partial [Enterococcus faecium]
FSIIVLLFSLARTHFLQVGQ